MNFLKPSKTKSKPVNEVTVEPSLNSKKGKNKKETKAPTNKIAKMPDNMAAGQYLL